MVYEDEEWIVAGIKCLHKDTKLTIIIIDNFYIVLFSLNYS